MASQYYSYYHPGTHGSYYRNSTSTDYYSHSDSSHPQSPPLHLVVFLSILFFFAGLSWYLNYEPVLESLLDQVKVILLLTPVLLLLALHCLAGIDRRWVPFLLQFPEDREAHHKVGGSPWGVALVLVLLIFMLSYRSSFQEWWFPLIRR